MEIRAKELWALRGQGLMVTEFVGGGILIVQRNFSFNDISLSVGDILIPYWIRVGLSGLDIEELDGADVLSVGQFGDFVLFYYRQEKISYKEINKWHISPCFYPQNFIFRTAFEGAAGEVWTILERGYG